MAFLNWVPFLSSKFDTTNWQSKLLDLEKNKDWDTAIELMKQVIQENPDNIDTYINMNYLIMNLLVEEDYNRSKHDYYEAILKGYFQESYKKFSKNPEYLFFTGLTGVMSEWFFGIEYSDVEYMLHQAHKLEPNNILYQWADTPNIYTGSKEEIAQNKIKAIPYAQLIRQKDSPLKKILDQKGSIGEYLWSIMIEWSKDILDKNEK